MHIVTSGKRYIDIDAYGGCIAYAELLRFQQIDAIAVSSSPMNESISPKVRRWTVDFRASYEPSQGDTFSLIDVSDPVAFDGFVDLMRVDEVIDHHPGFEDYWSQRPEVKTQIEFIGAACTLVYERWKKTGLLEKMTESSARVLTCGILDNTLNFGATVTTERDREAYDYLTQRAGLSDDWAAQYFSDCEASIIKDIAQAVRNDTKVLTFKTFPRPVAIGQLVVWDGRAVIDQYLDNMIRELSLLEPDWFMNLISLSDRRSYIITKNTAVKSWLKDLLKLDFTGAFAASSRPWLRKEIIKQDLTRHHDGVDK
jgi:inorganic pyrophosphatase/exopolyphosphatase